MTNNEYKWKTICSIISCIAVQSTITVHCLGLIIYTVLDNCSIAQNVLSRVILGHQLASCGIQCVAGGLYLVASDINSIYNCSTTDVCARVITRHLKINEIIDIYRYLEYAICICMSHSQWIIGYQFSSLSLALVGCR